MTDSEHTPQDLPPVPDAVWWHGLAVLILVILVNLAQTVLGVIAVIQFFWMLIRRERNPFLAEFGQGVARWLATTARFVSGGSDDRPFPWTAWK